MTKLEVFFIFSLFFVPSVYAQTNWVQVPGQSFSYSSDYSGYERKSSPKIVGAVLFDMKKEGPSGPIYYRGLIDCQQMRFTQDPKAIDLLFGNTVYANQLEQEYWWTPIHPDFWAYQIMRQTCGKKMK